MNYFILFGSSWIGFQCFLQNKQGAVQVVFLQYVCDTHFVATGTRRSIESGRRRHEYRLSLVFELRQTPGTELVRIIYRKLCHRIECSHRDGRIYARYTVQSVNQAFTAFYIFIVCVAQIILTGIQRCGRRTPNSAWTRNQSAPHCSQCPPGGRQRYRENPYK